MRKFRGLAFQLKLPGWLAGFASSRQGEHEMWHAMSTSGEAWHAVPLLECNFNGTGPLLWDDNSLRTTSLLYATI